MSAAEALSPDTIDRLKRYQMLLLRWQEKINLISPNTVKDSWVRHFEDSLQLLPLLPDGPQSLYDLGSGAGFPGLALSLACPDLAVTLVESDAKKCAFLAAVSRETGAVVSIENSRIEAASSSLLPPDIVTARALAPLSALFSYVYPWVDKKPDISFVFPKGAGWRDEVEDARAAGWAFDLVDHPSQTDPAARLLLFTNLRKNSV